MDGLGCVIGSVAFKHLLQPMNPLRFLSVVLALIAGPAAGGTARADDGQNMKMSGQTAPGRLVPATDKTDGAWLAKARAEYPLTTCTVSGDKLEGDMGAPQDFIYRQEGRPDRLVRFCCKDCLNDFNKNPDQYLKKIDDACAAKSKGMGGMPMQ